MCPAITNPASCEIRTVISFLHAKNMSTADIHLAHTHSPNKPKKFKQTSAYHLPGNCFLGQESRADRRIHTVTPELYCETLHFSNNEELMEGVETWLRSQAAHFFDTGIQKLIPRYDKYLSSSGDYVEK
ncbi:hypothetical protein B7P43_G11689 [Cryptotermes secundus]|uniref:Uncharacterized protein n=1 Tax=Cryptotermes secundus TaxID=105785 RepID=A0A2J7QXA0_9NEOP|nr:hypothetical protein B7P43_G11689 [Cryptotermes secundus]